jgi:alpha-tubulin suppressor-like RCC1 family protein
VISFGFAGYGQLGHGNELSQKFPKTIETKELKNEIIVQVAAGDDHTLLLTEKGEVLSFGNGHCGQLGHGDWHNFSIPKKIETDLLKNQRVVQIATGADFSLLLTETGRVLSFGQGFFGNLGIGNERNRSSPVFIEAEELKNQKVIRIAAGSSHSLLLTDRGNIYSFGSGIYGQLGHGDEQNQSIPKMMDSEALKGEKIVQIEAGGGYSLLLTEDGGVFSFGLGAHGRLGHGDEQSVSTPKRIESDALLGYRIVQVAAGASHSLLLTESGDVFSFGHGGAGRLGHGDTQDQWIPKLIDPNSFRGRKIKQIAAGGDHSLAVSEEGIVFSFGEGRHGALGLKENSARQSVPQEIKMGWIWSPHQYHLFRPFNSSERF